MLSGLVHCAAWDTARVCGNMDLEAKGPRDQLAYLDRAQRTEHQLEELLDLVNQLTFLHHKERQLRRAVGKDERGFISYFDDEVSV